MTTLLVQPNCAAEINADYLSLQFPLNLGYLASTLRRAGHAVHMLDLNVQDISTLEQTLHELKPSVVGITAMSSSLCNAYRIAAAAKASAPGTFVVLGGCHASALPEETIGDCEALDAIVYGEGERTIVELCDALAKGASLEAIHGLVVRRDGKPVRTPPRELIDDLDSIPFPARDLVPMELYARQHVSRGFSRREMRIAELITTRGCPNDCTFCATHINYGHRVRFRSLDNVTAEIQECMKKYGVTHISVEDDTFTLKRELVEGLCAFFAANSLTWNCNARVNTVDYELLKQMRSSGCQKIAFGVESGSPELLKKIKKRITLDQVRQAVRDAKRAGIRYVECDFMIGAHVDETLEDVEMTRTFINELKPDFMALAVMNPYPGTENFRTMIERGLLPAKVDWSQFTHFGNLKRYDRITHMTNEEMCRMQHEMMKSYYGSPSYLVSQIRQVRSLREIRYFMRLGIQYLQAFVVGQKKRPQTATQ